MRRSIGSAPINARSAREWRGIVDEWHRRGGSAREFCLARDLSLKRFEWWRWALKARGDSPHRRAPRPQAAPACLPDGCTPEPHAAVPPFVELVRRSTIPVTSGRCGSGVEIVLPGAGGERRIRVESGFDAITLRQVVATLEEVE